MPAIREGILVSWGKFLDEISAGCNTQLGGLIRQAHVMYRLLEPAVVYAYLPSYKKVFRIVAGVNDIVIPSSNNVTEVSLPLPYIARPFWAQARIYDRKILLDICSNNIVSYVDTDKKIKLNKINITDKYTYIQTYNHPIVSGIISNYYIGMNDIYNRINRVMSKSIHDILSFIYFYRKNIVIPNVIMKNGDIIINYIFIDDVIRKILISATLWLTR